MLNKNISIKDLECLSALRSKQFYDDQKALPPLDQDHCGSSSGQESGINPYDEVSQKCPVSGTKPAKTNGRTGSGLSECSEACQRLLKFWLSHEHPFHIQKTLFNMAGISSGSQQAKLKKELIKKDFTIEYILQSGKSRLSVLEPTEKAYNVAGYSKPKYESKGGYLHQFCAHHIKQWAKKQGYKVDVEFLLDNGKAVDLLLSKEGSLIFVEIAISEPVEKEISNIQKDLQGSLDPEKMIMAVKDKKMMVKLEKLIQKEIHQVGSQPCIKVAYAGSFISEE